MTVMKSKVVGRCALFGLYSLYSLFAFRFPTQERVSDCEYYELINC